MALIVPIKVVPSSGRNRWLVDKSNALKAYLKSPAQKGLANDELIKILAKAIKIPQKEINIISGATDRNKRIKINTMLSYEQLLAALGIQKQLALFNTEH